MDLYADILSLNQTAADERQYEVAFHLLAAALHAAADARDTERLEAIVALATEQGAAVDSETQHPMAACNATKRGNIPLYESLVATARAKLLQVRSEGLIEQSKAVINQDRLKPNS